MALTSRLRYESLDRGSGRCSILGLGVHSQNRDSSFGSNYLPAVHSPRASSTYHWELKPLVPCSSQIKLELSYFLYKTLLYSTPFIS